MDEFYTLCFAELTQGFLCFWRLSADQQFEVECFQRRHLDVNANSRGRQRRRNL